MAPFSVSWHTLLEELDNLPERATLLTPLSHDRFRITDVQEQRVVIGFLDREIDETRPLQHDQFETLYRRITEESGGFELADSPRTPIRVRQSSVFIRDSRLTKTRA